MAKNQNNNVAPATQKTEPEAKKDALATALAQIEKQFGKGAGATPPCRWMPSLLAVWG